MLSRRGWLALVVAGALSIGGRVLGAPELYVLGSSVVALVVLSVVYVRVGRSHMSVVRQVHPTRAHVGSSARVDLEVSNGGPRRSGLITLHDQVTGTRGASVLAAPLAAGSTVKASYALPTERRGVLGIGPLTLERSDPFELSSVTAAVAGEVEVTVYPRIDRIEPTALTTGNDPLAGSEHPDPLGRRGDDFYALRPYVVGDDLRRVHWPSTARHDDLMIRQEEIPWQGRVTVLLDDRPDRCSPEVFEHMVSAAASIVAASGQREDLLRLVATSGLETGFGAGHRHTGSLMEHLATIEIETDQTAASRAERPGGASLDAALAALDTGASPGALVVVAGELLIGELASLSRAGSRFGAVHIVRFHQGSPDDRLPGAPGGRAGGPNPYIEVSPGRPFPVAWDEAMIKGGWGQPRSWRPGARLARERARSGPRR